MKRLATQIGFIVVMVASAAAVAAAQTRNLAMTELNDPDGVTLRVFQLAVEGAGHTCEKALHVFNVDDGSNSNAFYKVVCSGGLEWQVTIIGKDNYVKRWTGTLLGE